MSQTCWFGEIYSSYMANLTSEQKGQVDESWCERQDVGIYKVLFGHWLVFLHLMGSGMFQCSSFDFI